MGSVGRFSLVGATERKCVERRKTTGIGPASSAVGRVETARNKPLLDTKKILSLNAREKKYNGPRSRGRSTKSPSSNMGRTVLRVVEVQPDVDHRPWEEGRKNYPEADWLSDVEGKRGGGLFENGYERRRKGRAPLVRPGESESRRRLKRMAELRCRGIEGAGRKSSSSLWKVDKREGPGERILSKRQETDSTTKNQKEGQPGPATCWRRKNHEGRLNPSLVQRRRAKR